jgi:hypothetical protein
MLDVVQRQFLALHGHKLRTPRAVAEEAGRDVDVADRGHRVVLKDEVDRQRVVEVDPIGHLLGAVQPRHGCLGHGRQIAVEPGPTGRIDRGVDDAVDAVGPGPHVAGQEPRPAPVVDDLRRRGVVMLPPGPQLGLGRRQGRQRHEQNDQQRREKSEHEARRCAAESEISPGRAAARHDPVTLAPCIIGRPPRLTAIFEPTNHGRPRPPWFRWGMVQLVARLTLDQKVPGSIPGPPAKFRCKSKVTWLTR